MSNGYERPAIREIGSVRQLTFGLFNKVGETPDEFTTITGGNVIGSLVPPN